MPVEYIVYSLLLLVLLFLSGYFSSTETALFSLSSMKIKAYEADPNPRRQLIARLLMQPRDLLVTVFMLNSLVNILIQNVFSSMAGSHAGLPLKVLLPLVTTLIFGEVIPKYIGLQNNVAIAYAAAPVIHYLQESLRLARKWIIAVTTPISRILFFFLRKEESISREELQHVLKTSEEQGVLQSEEAEMVWGFLSLQDSSVKELMSPKEDMSGFEIHEPLTKLEHLFADKKQTEVIVYEKDFDQIIGIISAKNYFLNQNESPLRSLLVKPFYVPENTPARLILRRLDEQHISLAIVIDEYGSTSGSITRQDILEPVLGSQVDAQDQILLYTRSGENEIIASGKLELSTFNELFDVDLKSENNMVTIGGWLTEQLGDIPKSGTKFKTDQFLFQVLAAEANRIRRIYIRKLEKKGAPARKIRGVK